MTGTGTEEPRLGGVLRLTWVTDHLAHVLEHSQSDEPSGTWTGLACPDHGLETGSDVDNSTLLHLADGDLADFIWEAPDDFTAEHGQLMLAAIRAHQEGELGTGQRLSRCIRGSAVRTTLESRTTMKYAAEVRPRTQPRRARPGVAVDVGCVFVIVSSRDSAAPCRADLPT